MMIGAILNASCPMGGARWRMGLSGWSPTLQRGAFRSSLDIKGKVQRIRRTKDSGERPEGAKTEPVVSLLKFDLINYPKYQPIL